MPRVIAFYKPYGVLTQFTDGSGAGRRTLKDYINVPSVYAVGRLDLDSEGLLLLTDDGALQHRLSHPRFAHEKTYWVQVEGVPGEVDLQPLRSGVRIQDYVTLPARVRVLPSAPAVPPRDPPVRFRKAIPTTWLEIVLTEGRNRQVRRMTAAVGYPTLRLIRYAVGPVRMEGLAPGEWRPLRQAELASLHTHSVAK